MAAILVQDRVFATSSHPDPTYAARRRDLFIIAVHCGSPSEVCFCTSMGTGPRVRDGFDLGITELLDTVGTAIRHRSRNACGPGVAG